MIFSHGLDDKVRDGTKTQTRRLRDRLHHFIQTRDGEIVAIVRWGKSKYPRKLWVVGRTYAIQSGRGVKGNGRFRLLKIRSESLQDISIVDCYAEGTVEFIGHKPIDDTDEGSGSVSIRGHFGKMWNSIHKKSGTRWEDNPENWVLEMEPANGR